MQVYRQLALILYIPVLCQVSVVYRRQTAYPYAISLLLYLQAAFYSYTLFVFHITIEDTLHTPTQSVPYMYIVRAKIPKLHSCALTPMQ